MKAFRVIFSIALLVAAYFGLTIIGFFVGECLGSQDVWYHPNNFARGMAILGTMVSLRFIYLIVSFYWKKK